MGWVGGRTIRTREGYEQTFHIRRTLALRKIPPAVDWFESLLPFLFLLIYFLAGVRKRRAKGSVPVTSESPDVAQPRARTPFEEIIRQIQEAAEKAQAGPQQSLPDVPLAVDAAPVKAPPALDFSPNPAFLEPGAFDHDKHGFGTENPFSEEAFELQPQSPPPPPHAPRHLEYNPHKSTRRAGQDNRMRKKPHPIVARLRRPGGLEEALILKEILDRPKRLGGR